MAGTGTATEIYRGGHAKALILTLPPGATTGRHTETSPYMVIPLTAGTLARKTFTSARGKDEKTTSENIRLRPFVSYDRKTGKKGVDHELVNTGATEVCLIKIYPKTWPARR